MALNEIENCDGWDCPHAEECNEIADVCPLDKTLETDFTDRTTPLDKLLNDS